MNDVEKTCRNCGRQPICPVASTHEPSPAKWCELWMSFDELPATIYKRHVVLLEELIKRDEAGSDKVDVDVYNKLVEQQDQIREIVRKMAQD